MLITDGSTRNNLLYFKQKGLRVEPNIEINSCRQKRGRIETSTQQLRSINERRNGECKWIYQQLIGCRALCESSLRSLQAHACSEGFKGANILQPKCLLNGQAALETPSAHTFLMLDWGMMMRVAVSVTIKNWHSCPFYTVIGQVSGCEKKGSVWTSSLQLECNSMTIFKERLEINTVFYIFKLKFLYDSRPFHAAFNCGCLKPL